MNCFKMAFLNLCLVLISLSSSIGSENDCEVSQYFNTNTKTCSTCSVCPSNTIIRHPCGVFSDTFCEPFLEFDHFRQSKRKPLDKGDSGMRDASMVIEQDKPLSKHTETLSNMERIRLIEGPWFPVSVGLLCVLCAICLGLAIYVICICFLRKRSVRQKQMICDPEYQNLMNISGCEYIQPYFNGDGQAISGATNIRSPMTHILMLPGGPMRLISNCANIDSGCSDQSLSTDYVYMKSTT